MNQYLKVTPPPLGQDLAYTTGFQRIVCVADGAVSSSDAVVLTSAALNELNSGWGHDSTEWQDLCRVLNFYLPCLSIDLKTALPTDPELLIKDELKIQRRVSALAQYVCVSTKRLVELLCALQSICLQRLSNTLQHNYRQSQKSALVWKGRYEALTFALDGLDSRAEFDIMQTRLVDEIELRCQAQSLNRALENKYKQAQEHARQSEEQFEQLNAELQSQKEINVNLERKVYQFKVQFSKDTANLRRLELAASGENAAITAEADTNWPSTVDSDAASVRDVSNRSSQALHAHLNMSQTSLSNASLRSLKNPRVSYVLDMEPTVIHKKGSIADLNQPRGLDSLRSSRIINRAQILQLDDLVNAEPVELNMTPKLTSRPVTPVTLNADEIIEAYDQLSDLFDASTLVKDSPVSSTACSLNEQVDSKRSSLSELPSTGSKKDRLSMKLRTKQSFAALKSLFSGVVK